MSNVGCRNFKYALLSQDDEKGVAYGEFVSVAGLNKNRYQAESAECDKLRR